MCSSCGDSFPFILVGFSTDHETRPGKTVVREGDGPWDAPCEAQRSMGQDRCHPNAMAIAMPMDCRIPACLFYYTVIHGLGPSYTLPQVYN